jgi:fumarate reductase flavoprotein subunit
MKKLFFVLSIFVLATCFSVYAQQFSIQEINAHSKGEKAGYLAGSHIKNGDADCISCHDGKVKVDDSELSVNTGCINCHGDLRSVAESVKPKGEINPHESHLDKINCTACHAGHTSS